MKVKLHSQILNISMGYSSRRHNSMTQGYKSWSHNMTNVIIPEVNMLKNSSTFAVSVLINLSIKLGFVSYFVDALRILTWIKLLLLSSKIDLFRLTRFLKKLIQFWWAVTEFLGFFSWFSRSPNFIPPTFSSFQSSLFMSFHIHIRTLISCHPSLHPWLGK